MLVLRFSHKEICGIIGAGHIHIQINKKATKTVPNFHVLDKIYHSSVLSKYLALEDKTTFLSRVLQCY